MNKILDTFQNLSNIQKILVILIGVIFFYGGSTIISYSVFSGDASTSLTGGDGKLTALPGPSSAFEEDPKAPKTEACPLNGEKRTKKAREFWEKRRPLAVMVENHTEARPQSGLSSADVVYEAVAEGGISRFMALFYCNLSDTQVGPVRSARTYFLD